MWELSYYVGQTSEGRGVTRKIRLPNEYSLETAQASQIYLEGLDTGGLAMGRLDKDGAAVGLPFSRVDHLVRMFAEAFHRGNVGLPKLTRK